MSTNNVLTKYSNKIGGARQIFTDAIEVTIGGGNFTVADLPAVKNVLYAGTPIKEDAWNRTAEIHYAFKVVEDVDATHIKVEKYGNSTVAKVGMFLMKAPADIATTGQGYAITEVDSSNETYDILTMSGDLGEVAGDILVEAVAEAADTTIKVVPNALQAADVYIDPNGYDFSYTAGYFSKGEVYSRRIPPICPAVLSELQKVTFFRYTTSR